jgi:hypothetical protein
VLIREFCFTGEWRIGFSAPKVAFFNQDEDANRTFVGGFWVQNPESTLSGFWDVAQVIFLGYVSISVPLQAGFDLQISDFSLFWWFEAAIDTYFLLDVLLNFRCVSDR